MQRGPSTSRGLVVLILALQIVPLLLFPPEVYSAGSQQWWFAALLAIMALYGTLALVIQRRTMPWLWDLLAFAQGASIISRIIMLLPHATSTVNGATMVNPLYLVTSALSIVMSFALLRFFELPDIRRALQPA